MPQFSFVPGARRALGLATLFSLALSSAQSSEPAASTSTLAVPFSTGQLMSIVSVAPKAGNDAAAARSNYLDNAFTLADSYGLKPLGSLVVSMAIIGDFEPSVVAFYSWPDPDAEARFDNDPDWPDIKATRALGWDELRFHDQVSGSDQKLVFRGDRFYTLATAWIDSAHPTDYEEYLSNIEPAVTAAGGRFFYEMIRPEFDSLDKETSAPSRLTLMEWEEASALEAFLNSEGFKRNAHLLDRGTSAFELLALSVPPGR